MLSACSLEIYTFTPTIIETDAVWIVEREVPNQRLRSCAKQSVTEAYRYFSTSAYRKLSVSLMWEMA